MIAACASSETKSDLNIAVDSDEIRVAVSEAVARGVVESLLGDDVECDGDIDDDFKNLLARLDRSGPRSRATYRDGENTIDARRRGGRLDLDITGQGSGRIEATMPWAIAECLLGNATTLDESITRAIKVKVTNSEGRNFSFKLD
jgi:hypothetical protein